MFNNRVARIPIKQGNLFRLISAAGTDSFGQMTGIIILDITTPLVERVERGT